MKVIGYGICGPGEARRYMRATMKQFNTLCDEVIILCNNITPEEKAIISEYGFSIVYDNREWGTMQWKIKQDFIEREVSKIASKGDMLVCLDMDEVLDDSISKKWIQTAKLDAYYVYVVDLWNDPHHYKPESCFWNVRIWRWNGETKFKQKPVHCGLAPEWTYHYHRHAPFFLWHYGLMDPSDRDRKIQRYEKYDPNAKHMDRRYYNMLKEHSARPFDPQKMHELVLKEVESYKQTKPQDMIPKKNVRFAYVRNVKTDQTLDIPEKHLAETLKRGGFEFLHWADDVQKDIEDLFEDVEVPAEEHEPERTTDTSTGSYKGSTLDQQRQFEAIDKSTDLDNDDADELFGDNEKPEKSNKKGKKK